MSLGGSSYKTMPGSQSVMHLRKLELEKKLSQIKEKINETEETVLVKLETSGLKSMRN